MLFEIEWDVIKMLFFNNNADDRDSCPGMDDHVFPPLEQVESQNKDGTFDTFDMAFLQQWGEPPTRVRAKCVRCGAVFESRIFKNNNHWSIVKLPKHQRSRL